MKLKQQKAKQSTVSKQMLGLSSRFNEEGMKIRYAVEAQISSKTLSYLALINANSLRSSTFFRYTTTCMYAITSCWSVKLECNI